MPKKRLTRAEIGELLRPRTGRQPDEVARLTLDGLEAVLKGIAAGDIPGGHTIDAAAVALGYLLAGCTEQAARAARQVVIPYALTRGVATGDCRRASQRRRSLGRCDGASRLRPSCRSA